MTVYYFQQKKQIQNSIFQKIMTAYEVILKIHSKNLYFNLDADSIRFRKINFLN